MFLPPTVSELVWLKLAWILRHTLFLSVILQREGKSAKDTFKLTSWISVDQLKVLESLLSCISTDQYSQLMFQEFLFRLPRNSIFLERLEGKLVWQRPWGSFSIEGWVADVRLAGLFLTQLNLRRYSVNVCTLQLKCKNETACPSLLACC